MRTDFIPVLSTELSHKIREMVANHRPPGYGEEILFYGTSFGIDIK